MVMPSPAAQIRRRISAICVPCLLTVATGLVIVLFSTVTEWRVGPLGISLLIIGGGPLVIRQARYAVDRERAAAHRRFLALEEAERQRTRAYCEQEEARLEARKEQALREIEERRAEIEGLAFVKALRVVRAGELDRPGGAIVKRFPSPEGRRPRPVLGCQSEN